MCATIRPTKTSLSPIPSSSGSTRSKAAPSLILSNSVSVPINGTLSSANSAAVSSSPLKKTASRSATTPRTCSSSAPPTQPPRLPSNLSSVRSWQKTNSIILLEGQSRCPPKSLAQNQPDTTSGEAHTGQTATAGTWLRLPNSASSKSSCHLAPARPAIATFAHANSSSSSKENSLSKSSSTTSSSNPAKALKSLQASITRHSIAAPSPCACWLPASPQATATAFQHKPGPQTPEAATKGTLSHMLRLLLSLNC